MNPINAQPRPRVLFENVPSEILAELSPMVPTSATITQAYSVHEPEYDILVTFAEDAGKRNKHLHVLSFGARYADGLHRTQPTRAKEMSIPAGIDPRLKKMVESTVVPNVPEDLKVTWAQPRVSRQGQPPLISTGDVDGRSTPLLFISADQYAYALLRTRETNPNSGLSLLLPAELTNHADWFRLFLELVAEKDPETVPTPLDWPTSDQWAPPALRQALSALTGVRLERERLLADLDAREDSLARDVEQEIQAAAAGAQMLLTADGDDLTDAVTAALTSLGFRVRNMDTHHDEKTGAKLEDLRVTEAEDPQWISLAEVKGYTRGAKVSDVPQITGRPDAAFTRETGDFPSTVWHIVNTWRGTDPSTRRKAIDNDAVDLRPLTDADGAIIDTRDLFLAWRDVQSGAAQATDVRKSLKTARTRWTYTHHPRRADALCLKRTKAPTYQSCYTSTGQQGTPEAKASAPAQTVVTVLPPRPEVTR